MINFYSLFQYDMIGWAPKEYNPGENLETGTPMEAETEAENGAPQSGFVWDEASGYYFDAASGFYYDGNRGNVFVIPVNALVISMFYLSMEITKFVHIFEFNKPRADCFVHTIVRQPSVLY